MFLLIISTFCSGGGGGGGGRRGCDHIVVVFTLQFPVLWPVLIYCKYPTMRFQEKCRGVMVFNTMKLFQPYRGNQFYW